MKPMVVITGVSQGLGRAMVTEFIQQGWFVVGCARSAKAMQVLNTTYPEQGAFSALDITDEAAVIHWAKQTQQTLGAPALIINNASVINQSQVLTQISSAEFEQLMRVNVNGVFYVMKAFLNALPKAADCIVVNISSGWGRNAAPQVAPYCASKFAIEGLTQAFAQEAPDNIAAVTLDPRSGIATPMLEKCWPQGMSSAPTPEQWAKVAVPYLMSLKREHNGQALTCPPVTVI